MGRHCAAFGCTNNSLKESTKTKNISFHRFPLHNPIILKKWLLKLRRKNFVPNHHSSLCSEHFSGDDFEIQNFTNIRYLKSGAIPTKFSYPVPIERNEVQSQLGYPRRGFNAFPQLDIKDPGKDFVAFPQSRMKDPGKGFKAFLGQREKKCSKCGFATFSLFVLYNHRHKCRGRLLGPVITCSYCRRKFNFLSLYKKHQDLCVKKLGKRKVLRNKLKEKHLGYKTKESSFSCPICEASFETKQQFVSHLKRQTCKSPEKVKKSSLSARKSVNPQKSIKSCSNFEEQESSVSWAEKRPLSVHDDELYNCRWCKSYYPSKKLLQMHLEMNKECSLAAYRSGSYRRHSLTARKSISAIAKKSFPDKKRKTAMMEFHNRKRSRSRSARKSLPSLKRKSLVSSDSKMLLNECPVCYRCFPDTFAFFQHQKKMNHWGKATKSFSSTLKCPFCSKEFMHILSRDAHIQNHTDVPMYKLKAFFKGHICNICSNTFVSVLAKVQHMRIQHPDHKVNRHSGSGSNTQSDSDNVSNQKMSSVPKSVKKKLKQQPNTCPVCCKAFSHTVLRNKHFNEAHLKIFECQFCNTKFKSTSSLDNHVKLSHKNILECRECKIKFKDELLLLQHVFKCHPNKDPKLFLPMKLQDSFLAEKEKKKSMEIIESDERSTSHPLWNMEYYCDVCNIGYLKLCGLQRHRQSKLHKDTVEKKLDAVQKSLSDLPSSPVLSPQVVKQPEILLCSECSEEFASIKDFVPHRLSHFSVQSKYLRITEQNPYMCEICSEVLDSHSKVQLHLFWHLQIESTASSVNNTSAKKKTIVPDRLSGQHVAKKSFTKQSINSLQEVVIGGVAKQLFTCENCNVGFTTKEHYNIHVRKLCKKVKVQMTSTPEPGVQNSIDKSISAENTANGIVHCVKCNFMFCNSVKYDQHKPQCIKINFDASSKENVCNLDAIKSALIRDICVAGCVTCGAAFESPVNSSHLSLHQDESNKSESDEVPEDVLHCALCNCLFPVSAFKAHKEFCKIPIHIGDKAGNLKHMDVLKSALELKCAIAGCISCGEPYDDLNKFFKHLNLHQTGEIKSDSQNTRLCNGGETSQMKNAENKNFSTDKLLKSCSEGSGDEEQLNAEFSNLLENSNANSETSGPTVTDHNTKHDMEELRENFSKLLHILIADADLMNTLGYGKLSIENVLVNVLNQMGHKPYTDKKFTSLENFRKNIKILLDLCLKDKIMQDFGKDKIVDEIVIDALNTFEAE